MSQTPRSVTELFGQYLRRQMAAQAEGLGIADPDGQAVPHEAASMQPVDPQLAWEDALASIHWITSRKHERRDESVCEVPPDWPSFVATQEPAIDLAFCIGNFPQLVRDLQPFLNGGALTAPRSRAELGDKGGRPISVPPTLLQWASAAQGYPQLLVAAGVLRMARRFDEASKLLNMSLAAGARSHLEALRTNEEAALAWHRGNAEEALELWKAQKSSLPVLFNRGVAALFLDRPAEAKAPLRQAVAQLPETSAWHHLGHLYLASIAARL